MHSQKKEWLKCCAALLKMAASMGSFAVLLMMARRSHVLGKTCLNAVNYHHKYSYFV